MDAEALISQGETKGAVDQTAPFFPDYSNSLSAFGGTQASIAVSG